jgi:hypothetical protein
MKLERLLLLLFLLGGFLRAAGTMPREARVEVGSHSTGSFDPRHALGGGLDGYWEGETAVMYTPESVRRMKEAGLGPVSYHLHSYSGRISWVFRRWALLSSLYLENEVGFRDQRH